MKREHEKEHAIRRLEEAVISGKRNQLFQELNQYRKYLT